MPTRKGLFQSIIITIESNHNLVLTSLLLFSGATWLMVAFWKYGLFLYNALDLAIYSQVFWNTSYGRWFEMSIHPQSYLGDHFEPLILLLTPIYALWRDPRMLLILQTAAIHLAAIPLYLLARNIFQKNHDIKYPHALALLIAISFLLNPLLHNALIFEFHLLPFFLLPFFWALYFAERGQLWKFITLLFITMAVREDVPLVTALAGVVVSRLFPSATKCRRWAWIMLPLILSAVWFVLSLNIISHFSPTGEFKFAIYYSALQGTWWQTLGNIMANPLPLLTRIFKITNLETLAGLFLPFSFLGLGSPTALLLGLLPFLQFASLEADSREILVLHYGVLFLPALFLAVIFALNKLASMKPLKISNFLKWSTSWPSHLGVLFLVSASIYGTLTLSQTRNLMETASVKVKGSKLTSINYAYSYVKGFKTIIADNSFLPRLSNRQGIYPIKYILDGQQQLSNASYTIPEPVDALILDQEALLRVSVVWKDGQLQFVSYNNRVEHLRNLIEKKRLRPVWARDGIAIFRNESDLAKIIPLITHEKGVAKDGTDIGQGIKVRATVSPIDSENFLLEMRWAIDQPTDENYFMDLHIEDDQGRSLENYILDPGWGIEPTSSWQTGAAMVSYFIFSRPPEAKKISFSLFPTNEMIEKEGGLRDRSSLKNNGIIIEPIVLNIN